MVFSNNLLLGAVSAAADAYLIEQSLLFNDDDSAYLNRTPSVAGNRKTWTWSGWMKRANIDAYQHFICAGPSGSDFFVSRFGTTGKLELWDYSSSTDHLKYITTAVFNDSSAWYHIVFAVDTTQATASNRVKIYVNGVQVTAFDTETDPSLNFDTHINSSSYKHEIGALTGSGANVYTDGLMALPILVDGAALDATSFGETDDDGFWNPIEFTGATTTTDNVSVGGTASAETTFLSFVPANAFDGNTSTRWISSATPAWLEYDRGSGNGVISTSYSISCGPSGSASTADMPKNWTIEGYNGSSWDTLATVTGEAAWSLGETRLYTFTNTTSYEKYRIDITLQQGGGAEIEVGELRFYAAGSGYGTNGFQLDYADTSDFGADVNYTGDTSVTFTDSSVNSGSATAYTFSSQAIGTASADRVVVVGTSGGAGATNPVSSMTIGGVSAVKAIGIVNSTGTEIWYATVPTGTTASVVVNWGGTKSRCGIGVWALTGVTGVGATNTSTSSTATLTVSGRAKDIVLAVYGGKDHASVSFSGVTENYDEDISGAGSQYQAGGSKKLTATGSNTITVTPNTGATEVAAVSAVFLATGNNGYFDNNFDASDQLEDTPTDSAADEIGNFATFNPLNNTRDGGATLSNGNLNYSATSGNSEVPGTIVIPEDTTDTWVIEFTNVSLGSNRPAVGLIQNSIIGVAGVTGGASEVAYNNGGITIDTVGQGSITTDATIRFEYNGTDNEVEVFTAGVSRGTYSWTPAGPFTFYAARAAGTATCSINTNISLMEGTVTAGAKSFGTQNLPAPTIADGSQQFTPVLYTGTGSELAITSLDFTPDFVWIKNRDATDNHMLYDSVRGATKDLHSNTTDAETTTAQTLKSFDSAGFTLGTDVQVNTNTEDYVAWCWKAGGAASSNTDGSITTSVSANPTAGFSIISYTGTGASYPTPTIGHGLGSAPKFYIIKNRDQTDGWAVFHEDMNANPWNDRHLRLDTNAAVSGALNVSGAAPTSSIIYLDSDPIVNASSEAYICYAWSEVEGFSKFGGYTGNGSNDGPFIYTGFKPACIIFKKVSSTSNWGIFDNARDPYNEVDHILFPNLTNADVTPAYAMDFLSNGVKLRNTSDIVNVSGQTYIYMAFAEHPFQGADGVTQARAR